jgi:Coenzyme PQQ synthesis protein D (PqqD)
LAGDRIKVDTGRVEAREIEGELVMLDLGSHVYLRGNRSAAVLWPLLTEGATRDELMSGLVQRYGVDETTAANDVDGFLGVLRTRGWLDGAA